MGRLISRRDALLLLCAAILMAAMIAAIQPWGEFPLNDDWVYARNVFRSTAAGRLVYTGFESAFMIPQVLIGSLAVQWFGESFLVLRCVGWLFWLLGTWGLLLLLDAAGAATVVRTVSVACFVAFPACFINASSFMTDPIFLAFWIWSVVFLQRSLVSGAPRDWAGLAGMIGLATLQRQFGVFLSLGVLYFAWQEFRRSRNLRALLPYGLVLGVAWTTLAITLAWWRSIFHLSIVQVQFPLLGPILQNWMKSAIYLGLIASPFMLALDPAVFREQLSSLGKRHRRWLFGFASIMVLEMVYLGIRGEWMPYFGNQISEFGAFRSELIPGARDVLLPPAIQVGLSVLGVAGSIFLVLQALSSPGDSGRNGDARLILRRILLVLSLIYVLGMTITCRVWFDRYLLPLFPAALIFAQGSLSFAPRWRRFGRVIAATMTAGFAVWSMDATQDFFSWNQARWDIGRWAVAQGIPADQIVGGYEWEGWFREFRGVDEEGHGWGRLFKSTPDRAHVGFSVPPGARELHQIEFQRMPWHKSGRVFLYELP
jgi:hypothetical protein